MVDLGHHISLDAQAPIPDLLTERSLLDLAAYVFGREGVETQWTLAFRFTTNEEIQRIHLEFMGLDSPTDIMTFPYDRDDNLMPDGSDRGAIGGDIVISVDQASVQAVDAGWSELDELWFLAIHGMLHLVGWDDHDDNGRMAMLDRQSILLDGWKAKNYRAIHPDDGKTEGDRGSD